MRKIRKALCLLIVAALVLALPDGCGVILAAQKSKKVKISSVKITNTWKRLRLRKGKSFKLKTSVKAKFISSNRRVVRVNSQGLLKGLRVGTAKITAVSRINPQKKASISVSVTKDVLVTNIILNRTRITADEFNVRNIRLSARKIIPSNAKNKKVEWFSSDAYVADVDEDGMVTTGNAGTATIMAWAADQGGAYAACRVTVTENKDMEQPAERGKGAGTDVMVSAAPPEGGNSMPSNEPEETATSTPDHTAVPPDVTTPAPTGTLPPADKTPRPTGMPTLPPTARPTIRPANYKNPEEVEALKEMIAGQRALGATVSEDLDSEEYEWNGEGNLVEIRWGNMWNEDAGRMEGKDLRGSISLSPFPSLIHFDCGYSQLSELDVSGNPDLEYLSCWGNRLSSLDVGGNPFLESLSCGNNLLKSLDVSGNSYLEDLICEGNQLSSLDVSGNLYLEELICEGNQLRGLDVSRNPDLIVLYCGGNALRSLDVSGNPRLWSLGCGGSELRDLDVSGNPALERLFCGANKLRSLDVSGNPALTTLWCWQNQLSTLDVSGNPALVSLDCWGNQLSSLDVSRNPNLTELSCDPTVTVIGYKQ